MKNATHSERTIIYTAYRDAIKSIKLKDREPTTSLERYQKLKRWKKDEKDKKVRT
tara:strand:+ start:224 stop:388 length:165 start_codon:yes stop_codon:yes gene_type:complete